MLGRENKEFATSSDKCFSDCRSIEAPWQILSDFGILEHFQMLEIDLKLFSSKNFQDFLKMFQNPKMTPNLSRALFDLLYNLRKKN